MSAKVLGLDLISDVLKKINSKEACEGGIKGAGRQEGTKLEHSSGYAPKHGESKHGESWKVLS